MSAIPKATRFVLPGVWVISALLAVAWIDHGWIPHDEGTLAQSAERVLAGELPHRDFDEGYTGGLSFLNAAAFRVFGTNLLSLRLPLLLFFLAWVPSMYYVASRFVTPLASGATVLLAVAWSVPNYSAPMPSWYNLFFAIFGTAAMLRHLETNRRRWLVVAGLCAGLSCLVKIVGLYLVAAVLFFLAFREQFLSGAARERVDGTPPQPRTGVYTQFALLFLLLFLTLLVLLVFDQLGVREFVHFVLPSMVLAFLFVWNERSGASSPSAERFATLARFVVPFLLGLSIPVIVFLLPYVISGSLPALGHGVFVQSLTQLTFGQVRPPSLLATTAATIPLIAVLASALLRGRLGWVTVATVGLGLGAVLVAAPTQALVYRLVWYSVRALVPVISIAGVLTVMRSDAAGRLSGLRRQQLLVLLCMMVMIGIVQFPFSTPIYFLYVAPVIALAATAVVSSLRVSPSVPAAVLCFYLLFAVLWVNGAVVYSIGFYHVRAGQVDTLDLDRGGLRVSRAEKEEYEQLVEVLRARASGDFIYATPDCPEVYFLSGLRNPTPTFFDYYDDPVGRTVRILNTIEQHSCEGRCAQPRAEFLGRRATRSRRGAYRTVSSCEARGSLRRKVERMKIVADRTAARLARVLSVLGEARSSKPRFATRRAIWRQMV